MKKLKILSFIAVLLFLVGCYTDKKATRQGEKLFDKKPVIAASLSHKYFPIAEVSRDTTINYLDTIIAVDCPDAIKVNDGVDYGEIYVQHDTIRIKGKTVQIPVRIPYPVIQISREDSARNVVLQAKINSLEIAKAKVEGKLSTTTKFFISFIILFVLSLLGNILQLKKII